ncbi:MAG: TIGR01212 family radical SAM protein [Desulfovibrionaceae bacterium]|nr:TIGR01212 family radical SAM protein [Desulfovibrionaceae bacterium]MBF0512997.1 TIGR01212 family radical SAM protein [Desulfovibrionaceae bacterium]
MRYYSLSRQLRQRLGSKAGKIPLDAGFSCPNRDAATGLGGCLYCPPHGAGSGAHARGESLADQWDKGLARLAAKHPGAIPLAYLQAYSNTHGPLARLREVLAQVAALPGVGGLCLGTRPDCLDGAKLAAIAGTGFKEIRLEIGLQSSDPDTLARINRGHTPEDFARAARAAAASGLTVCAHVIAGLPGENQAHFLRTVDFINRLPVAAVKFHNCYVAKDTGLAGLWREGAYEPLTREAYLAMIVAALEALRPDIAVERLGADPAPGELLAPDWAGDKRGLLDRINARLEALDAWQGKHCHASGGQGLCPGPPR